MGKQIPSRVWKMRKTHAGTLTTIIFITMTVFCLSVRRRASQRAQRASRTAPQEISIRCGGLEEEGTSCWDITNKEQDLQEGQTPC